MGQFKAELSGVHLQSCCKETLEFIRVKLEVGKILERFLVPAVFVALFVSPSKGSALSTASSIYGTDWEMLVKATAGVGLIAKKQVRDAASFQQLKHNGQLRDFWSSVHDAFLLKQ